MVYRGDNKGNIMNEIRLNTFDDSEQIFNTIHGFVCKDWRVSWSDKYDCAVDIWMKLVDFEQKNKHVNITYLRKRVKDRITNWINKAYRKREVGSDTPAEYLSSAYTSPSNFLSPGEIRDITDKLPEGAFETYQALFDDSASVIAKRSGITDRTVRNHRKKFLNEVRESMGDEYFSLLQNIKNPGGN